MFSSSTPWTATVTDNPSHDRRRRGVIALELITVIPIFVIAAVAILQLGAMVGSVNNVALASRNGAMVAARVPGTSTPAALATLDACGIDTTGVAVTENVSATAVQVTVEVPLKNACPDFLNSFGFTIVGRNITVATVMPLNP